MVHCPPPSCCDKQRSLALLRAGMWVLRMAGLLGVLPLVGGVQSSWADGVKLPVPAGLDQAAALLWNQTWEQLGEHFPDHVLSDQQRQAIRVPLAEGEVNSTFAQLAGGDLEQLRSRLAELQFAASEAALVGEDEFFLRLVPSSGANYAETVTVFDASDHGVDGGAKPGTGNGVDLFRVPSLCKAGRQILLAFSEARVTNGQESGQDCVPTGIAMKRSIDGGQTWGNISYPVSPQYTVPGATNGLSTRSANPVTVWEEERGRVHLHFVKGAHSATDCSPSSTDDETDFFNFYMFSDDYGDTWSSPIDISTQLGRFRGCMPGPDKAVTVSLSSGETRIVVPCHLATSERENGEAVVYYSNGMDTTNQRLPKSWSVSSLGKGMDETTITVAQPPSTLLVSMRNGGGHPVGQPPRANHTRAQRLSTDGGTTWSAPITFPASLPDPYSEGSLCTAGLDSSHPDSQLVLLSNAPMVHARAQLSLHMTADVGRSWGPGMEQGGCIPVTSATAADTSEHGGARCRKLVDGATFSDYSSLWCAPQSDTPPLNIIRYGVLWGTCSSPFPFQVGCQRPHDWSVKYSYGNFPVRGAAEKPGGAFNAKQFSLFPCHQSKV